jgi:hypothetical protein
MKFLDAANVRNRLTFRATLDELAKSGGVVGTDGRFWRREERRAINVQHVTHKQLGIQASGF